MTDIQTAGLQTWIQRFAGRAGRLLALGSALVLLAGCSKSATTEATDLVPVTGMLTYKGQPVPGARVVFHPAESTSVKDAAFAETGPQGRFQLVMQGSGPGAVPGDYIVTVMHPVDNLPGSYESLETTPLLATVEDNEQNEFPLILED